MTIGDIIAIVAGVLTIYLTWIAAVVTTALIAGGRVESAKQQIEVNLNRSIWIGVATALVIAAVCHRLNVLGAGPAKPLEIVILAVTGAIGLVGTAAVARLVAMRIDAESHQTFPTLFRATALILGASFAPVVGWLFILPALVVVSLGAGITALTTSSASKQPSDLAAPNRLS